MTTTIQAELLHPAQAQLGEGPIWDGEQQVLWWVDIEDHKVCRYDPATREDRRWDVGQRVGTVVGRASGGLMLAVEQGFAAFDPDRGKLEPLSDPEADLPGNRFNDGKCDPHGRLWAGTMSLAEKPRPTTGALYSLDREHRVQKHLTELGVSNGIVWTSDAATMYYIDSATRRVDAFDFDNAAGTISGRRTVWSAPDELGSPDGMAIDAHDKLWVAFWEGWSVCQIDPLNGAVETKVEVPAARVTACAFAGAGLDELYITTASFGLDASAREAQPQAGDLFVARPGVSGVPAMKYAG